MHFKIIKGELFTDDRGSLKYNNDFDASIVKRFYIIQNVNTEFVRGWQGHEIESRWFSALSGSFKINLIAVDDWENPSKELKREEILLYAQYFDILYCPPGYITAIQALEDNAKLLVMADYLLGATKDEHRYSLDYFHL